MAIDIGTGTTISFTGFTYKIRDVRLNIDREEIRTSHMETTGVDQYIGADLYGIQTEIDYLYDPAIALPLSQFTGAPQTLTVNKPLAGTNFSGDAFIKALSLEIPFENLMQGTAMLRWISFTDDIAP